MTPPLGDRLLAADRGAIPELDRIRKRVLDAELRSRRPYITWKLIAASWLLIAILRALTPNPAPSDPNSAALARTAFELGKQLAFVSSPKIEPQGASGHP